MSFAPPVIPNFQGGNVIAMASHGSDANLHVEFFVEDEYQTFQSEKEGRAIYKPVNKVRIAFPGAKSDIIKHVQMRDEPNSPSHPNRFPRQWAAFQSQQAQVPDGTPLEMCKFIAGHRVKELKAANVHTAEQLASMPDSILQTLGMGAMRERDLAKAYISEDAKITELSAALAREAAMKADMDALRTQMAELNALMRNGRDPAGVPHAEIVTESPVKRGPGRPKKEQDDAL
jgi:hypothetical protein